MSKTVTSNSITFIDTSDNRKLDVYITSNLPTTQIYNSNTSAYTPNWETTSLQLSADVYLDSKKVTPTKIEWHQKVGATQTDLNNRTSVLTVSTNISAANPIVTYVCKATYDSIEAFSEIAFTRVDAGKNGSNGANAPAVLAQYSIDGTTNWTSTLNTATHKYVRHSYDGGNTWTVAIKMVGDDGTSVAIKGTATSVSAVSGTSYYTVVYGGTTVSAAEIGDSYLYGGNLYVCVESRSGQDYFANVGSIQGPKGSDGKSSYVFVRYATDSSGSNMSTSPNGKTYIGVYTSDTNVAPTTANVYTWSKFVGDNAKSIVLSGDSQVFKVSKANVISPSTIKVTAQEFNTTVTSWTYSTNGGQTFDGTAPTGVSRNGNTVTVTGSTITANSIVIKASDGIVEDVFTIYKAVDGVDGSKGNDGAPAPIAFLTNENITFSANSQGQIAATTIMSSVAAYNGATKVTPTIGEITGLPSGMTITPGTASANNEVPLTITISNNATLGDTMGVVSVPVISPVSTVLYLTWSKVNAGANGSTGAAGADAYTVILTNESNTFAGDISNAIASSTTTQVLAYKGATEQSVSISSVNGRAASLYDTETGIDGLKFKCSAISGTSPTITFTCTSEFVSASGSIPIVLSVGGVSFKKMFTYSIAFKGATGEVGPTGQTGSAGVPATAYWLVSSASVVHKTSTGTIAVTPSTLTFTGKSATGVSTPTDYACRWAIAYSTDGTNYTNLYTSTANESSKAITVATTYKTIRVRMYLAGGTTTLLDEQIIPVVSDGATGPQGVGVKSTTVAYGVSDSAVTKPDDNAWQSTIPTVAEGKYLWTRTIIDYTDDAVADTVTYTYAKQGVTGATGATGSSGTSVTVKSIKYQSGTSATVAPTSTWSDSVVAVAEGNYLWTQTTFSDNKVAYGVAKQGAKGDTGATGRGVSNITEYYLATTSSSGVTTSTSGWTTTVQTIDATKKYLWNYEVVTYTDNTTSTTNPIIIGVFGNTGSTGATGKGIKSVTEYYLATASSSGVTTSTSGWTTTMQTLTATNKYLWNYELITYTDDSKATINPVIIGVYGDKGSQGDKGVDAVTFQVYAPNGYLLTKDLSEITLQTLAYEGSTAITSGATYQWAQYDEGAWENISGAMTQTLTVTKADVVKSKSYKCTMTYKSKQYTDTATVQDKTDIYSSLIQTAAKYSSTNKYYWVLYSMVYSDEGERDKLLGPISTIAPDNPTSGQYWYKIDEANYTVTLMKYSGTAWATTTDKQELVYDWSLINDADIPISLGSQSKVKIITASDFSKTCSVQCNIRGSESIPISYSNQILIDPSDPIISSEEPINPTPGQLWIKAGTNGLYTLLVWDASLEKWVTSEADSRVKVHISKPTSYEVGDVWVVGSDYEPTIYINGVAQTTKHLAGTMLKAQYSSQSYKDSDWVEALNYKKEIDNIKDNLNTYNQFFDFDEDGLTMQAKNQSGVVSEFKTKLTNTELGFYQGENKVAHINNNQLNISKAEITNGMAITGNGNVLPVLEIGNFTIMQESNGSLSIGLKS